MAWQVKLLATDPNNLSSSSKIHTGHVSRVHPHTYKKHIQYEKVSSRHGHCAHEPRAAVITYKRPAQHRTHQHFIMQGEGLMKLIHHSGFN